MLQDGSLNSSTKPVAVHTPNTAKIMQEAAELLQLEKKQDGDVEDDYGVESTADIASNETLDGAGLDATEDTADFLDDVESFLTSV